MKNKFIKPMLSVSVFDSENIVTGSGSVAGTENADFSTAQSFYTKNQTTTSTLLGELSMSELNRFDMGV